VGVLWETFNTSEYVSVGDVIESVELEGTKAKFTLPEDAKAGNALIAAKNSAGKILWSWHIWVVDMDADAKGVIYPSGSKFMDRNLGALNYLWELSGTGTNYDARSLGLFYQWGRKDPFVASDETWYNFAKTTLPDKTYVESGSDTNTKGYAISHPTHVISNSTWNNDASLWGIVKTIYDPCPVGWRVSEPDAFSDSQDLLMGYPRTGRTFGYYSLEEVCMTSYVWTSSASEHGPVFYEGEWYTFTTHAYSYEMAVRCTKDANFTVTTNEPLDITESAATLSGKVEVLDGTHIEVRGFAYRENSSDLNMNDSAVTVIESDGQDDEFSAAVTGLKPNTTYYYKAFAKGNYNTRYGETLSFKTKVSGTGGGFTDDGDYEWE
jgi:hypothetical protein